MRESHPSGTVSIKRWGFTKTTGKQRVGNIGWLIVEWKFKHGKRRHLKLELELAYGAARGKGRKYYWIASNRGLRKAFTKAEYAINAIIKMAEREVELHSIKPV